MAKTKNRKNGPKEGSRWIERQKMFWHFSTFIPHSNAASVSYFTYFPNDFCSTQENFGKYNSLKNKNIIQKFQKFE